MISTLGGGVWVEIDRSEACEKALSYVVWRDLRIFSGISKQAHSCRSGIFNFQKTGGALKIDIFLNLHSTLFSNKKTPTKAKT